MSGKKRPDKPYWEMNTEELAQATAEFDREMVINETRPLTASERARWEQIRRKPGRPKFGRGVKVVSVSVERDLLARADALAKALGLTRAAVVARGLKAVLAAQGRL